MENWKSLNVDGKSQEKLHALLDRVARRKGIFRKDGKPTMISMARYRTDGISTISVVTVTSFSGGLVAHGYGVAALSPKDKASEQVGAWLAVARAIENAVNSYYQLYMQDKTAKQGKRKSDVMGLLVTWLLPKVGKAKG